MTKYILKILIAGDGAVGKTTLLYRYVQGFFKDDRAMTIGVDFHLKNMDIGKDSFQLLLYDFAGQERFRFMIDQWVHGANGALLLFDTTRMETFDSIEKWVPLIRKEKKELPVILVASKCDLEEFAAVDDDDARDAMEKHKLQYYIRTSSKIGLNVDEVFEQLIDIIIN